MPFEINIACGVVQCGLLPEETAGVLHPVWINDVGDLGRVSLFSDLNHPRRPGIDVEPPNRFLGAEIAEIP